MRVATALIAAGAVVAAGALAGCGSSGGATTTTPSFLGSVANPPRPAPPLALRDSLGHEVNIKDDLGKAVLVTFIYSHCPDTCPLIVANLRNVQAQLGPEAKNVRIIAVSTDPVGDTPKAVNAFIKARRMTGRMEYLLGSKTQLARVWRAWGIKAQAAPKKVNPGLVSHSALVYGISASGKLTTLYPSNFKPSVIVHDVPILASE